MVLGKYACSYKNVVKCSLTLIAVGILIVFGRLWTTNSESLALRKVTLDIALPILGTKTTEGSIQSNQTSYLINTHPNKITNLYITSPSHTIFNESPSRDDPSKKKSYVLALGYTEQLSAATHTMFTLGSLASDWGANVVEPCVKKSFIFGLRNVVPPAFANIRDRQTLRLFDIYNSTEINNVFHKDISPHVTMSDYNKFVSEAPTDIIVFHFGTRSSEGSQQRIFALDSYDTQLLEAEFLKGATHSVFECLSMNSKGLQHLVGSIEDELNTRKMKLFEKSLPGSSDDMGHFRVKRVLCLDSKKVYRSDTLQQYLPDRSTIIFTNWRGCGLQNCHFTDNAKNETHEWRDSFRYAILTKTRSKQRLGFQHQLHTSSIEKTAKHYLDYLGYTQPFVSIHVRTERIVRVGKEKKDPIYSERCLKELLETVKNLTREYTGSHNTLLLTDVGSQYGTSTCRGKNCKRTETSKVTLWLKKLGFHEKSYDPHVLSGIENNGYVSLVEMHMLALGDKLILVGFGGFQANLENLFLSRGHQTNDVIHICHTH